MSIGQVETDETENWNGKRKAGTESWNGKAENWKWSSDNETVFAHAQTIIHGRMVTIIPTSIIASTKL